MTPGGFIPWRDDCLLPEESVYSAFSKIAWFQAITPARYLARLRGKCATQPVNFYLTKEWTLLLQSHEMMPDIQGRPMQGWISTLSTREEDDLPIVWRSKTLRVCDLCLREGVHLRIHQDLAVHLCPVHLTPLREKCKHCSRLLPLLAWPRTQPFCCGHCGKPLTLSQVFGLPRTLHQQREVQLATEQLMASVLKVRQMVESCFKSDIAAPSSLAALRINCIQFESARRYVAAHPAIRRCDWPSVKVATESFSIKQPQGRHEDVDTGDAISQLELQIAAAHVVTWFLHRARRTHTQCLDAPFQMFGTGFNVDLQDPNDILDCCPVALGFWFWRLSLFSRITSYFTEKHLHDRVSLDRTRVLVHYKTLRSHLQYCLYVTHQVLHVGAKRLDKATRLRALEGVEWSSANEFFVGRLGSAVAPSRLVRFELQGRWMDVPCYRNAAHASRVRRRLTKLSARTISNAGDAVDPGDGIPSDGLPSRFPFTLMRFERFLLEHRVR